MQFDIKVKYFTDSAIALTQAHSGDAGWDLYSNEDVDIPAGETVKVHTGIAVALPDGTFGGIYARSGLATKNGLRPANCVGVCDSKYRGEYIVPLHNDSVQLQKVRKGDRIAQFIVQPYIPCSCSIVNTLEDTERGHKGFGSSGV